MLVTRMLALPLAADALQVHGLGRPLSGFVAEEIVIDYQAELWTTELCQAVGAGWEILTTTSETNFLPRLFANPQICSFLLVHDDCATTWFNKERLDEFVKWLTLWSVFEQAQGVESRLVPVRELSNLAAAAGYRVPVLLQLAEEIGKKEA
jgi:hypothetical protein